MPVCRICLFGSGNKLAANIVKLCALGIDIRHWVKKNTAVSYIIKPSAHAAETFLHSLRLTYVHIHKILAYLGFVGNSDFCRV